MSYSFSTYKPFYRRNLLVAGPIILSQVGTALVQLIDTFMVGQLGTYQLAAVSFATSVFFLGVIFANGLMMSVTPVIGHLFADGDKPKIGAVITNHLVFSFIVGTITMGILLGVRYLLPHMGQDPGVIEYAIPYFVVITISALPNTIFMAFKQIMEGLGNTSISMVITLIANVLNVVFNYLLIYGKLGFPEMGMLGAGVSTLISRAVMPLMFFVYLIFSKKWWSYFSSIALRLVNRTMMRELFTIGLPIALHLLMEMTAFAISAIMMGWLGAVPLAGHQIASNISNLLFMVVLGISSATTIRVSHQYGAHDYHAMRMAANASIHLCLVANAIMGALIIIFRRQLAMLFSNDSEVIALGAQLLILVGIYQLSDGMQAVGAGILRGLKDVKITMFVAFFAYIVINIPLGYLLAFVLEMGPIGIWISFIGGLFAAALLFRMRYVRDFRRIKTEMEQDNTSQSV